MVGATNIKHVLAGFEAYFGQLINFIKSLVYFSSCVFDETRALVERELGVRCSLDPKKYLGLPIVIRCNKRATFRILLDRIKGKIGGWCNH